MESIIEGQGPAIFQRRHNGQSLDDYRHFKLLPHISEEYQFRITNKLLLQKIANPRRDRIIIDSLAHTSSAHLYKSKRALNIHQDVTNNRRKNVLTATHKKRQMPSRQHECKCRKQEQADKRTIVYKKDEEDLRKNYEDREWNNMTQQGKNEDDDVTVSRMMQSQLRSNFIGKIVRNNSSHLIRRLPKKAILKSNYFFNTNIQAEQKQASREKPQQKIRRIVKRIYQDHTKEKQNLN